ncbi:translocation/assembly module TamB domain-containing protein [Methylomagnum sp.]
MANGINRFLAGFLASLLLLFLSLSIALLWLTATEPGLRWLALEIAAHVPGVAVDSTTGTLLDGFTLNGIAYRDASAEARLDSLAVTWEPADLWERRLHFRSIKAQGLRVLATGKSESKEPPAWPELQLPLAIAVDDFELIGAEIRTAAEAEPTHIDRLTTALFLGEAGLRIDRLALAMPQVAADVAGRVEFSGAKTVDLKTGWQLTLPDQPPIQGAGTVSGDPGRLTLRQTLQAPLPAELAVTLDNPLADLTWTARASAPKFSPAKLDPSWKPWPLALSLQGQGTLATASVTGDFTADLPDVGVARGQLKAHYREPGDVVVETLTLVLPRTGTEFVLDGKAANLRDAPEFNIAAHWKNLLWPPEPKAAWRSPEGTLAVSGNLKDIRFDLDGKLRDQRVESTGNIGVERDRTTFRAVRVHGAGVDVAVDGTLGARLDFAWTLKADDLGAWLPGAKGKLSSRGTLQGPQDSPAIDAELTAQNLRYDGNGAAQLTLNLKAGLQPDSPLAFKLSAEDVSAGGQRLDADLAGQGTRAKHRLTGQVNLALSPASLDFTAEGGVIADSWAGQLSQFDFNIPPVGRWDLQRPTTLKLGKAGGALGLACWDSQGAEACLQAKFSAAGDWRLSTELSRLPLARFKANLPEAVAVAGMVQATASFSGQGGRVGEGQLALTVAGARLDYRGDGKNTLSFAPESLALRADVSSRGTGITLDAEQPGFASLHGRAQLAGPLDPDRLKQAALAGGIQVGLANLAILDPFVEDIDHVQGAFNADLQFNGTLASPVLALHAAVPEAGFGVPRLGIQISQVKLEAVTHTDSQVTLQGRAVSGKGEIRLDGTATLSEAAGWPVNLTIKGNRFLAADIPEAKAWVSPDLGIGFEGGTLVLKGQVTVPEASLHLPEQTGTVKPSEDVVMVGAKTPPEKTALPIETHVDVVLGNQVRVQGAGFKGRVDGHVLVDQAPKGPALGTGQIVVRDGKYSIYGVELDINDGRLLFAHSPVDNPGLDISVTRKTDDITAGAKVLGTAQKPSVTLYSDQPMSQTDILAYLVTGKPFGLASQQEGGMLQSAAASLGGSAGVFLAKEVSSRLGLGGFVDISMQSSLHTGGFSQPYLGGATSTASGTQSAALFLGKYLTPRLYVQYGMGLFQTAYVFRVRYELSKHWKIQTETGEYSGGDLLYQWEK